MSTAIPTLAPNELTYRVGWEVVAETPQQVTIRIRRVPAPEDSDGIPVAVDAEVSLRTVGTDQITAQLASKLNPAQKVTVLIELAELAARSVDAHNRTLGDVIEYPILLENGRVVTMIRRWSAFQTWYRELALIGFDDLWTRLRRTHSPAFCASALAFLRELGELVPTMAGFPDQAHRLLELEP